MDRRTFLAWLGGAGAAFVLPKTAFGTTSLDDERPLLDHPCYSVTVRGDKYVIPVRVESRSGSIHQALDCCHSLIDRPVFGFKPGSLLFTELAVDANGAATALLVLDWEPVGKPHTFSTIDIDPPHEVRTFSIYKSRDCRNLRFVPRNISNEEARRISDGHCEVSVESLWKAVDG